MNQAEFDKFAEEYYQLHNANIRLSEELPDLLAEYKIRDVSEMLASTSKCASRILDFLPGVGNSYSDSRHSSDSLALPANRKIFLFSLELDHRL